MVNLSKMNALICSSLSFYGVLDPNYCRTLQQRWSTFYKNNITVCTLPSHSVKGNIHTSLTWQTISILTLVLQIFILCWCWTFIHNVKPIVTGKCVGCKLFSWSRWWHGAAIAVELAPRNVSQIVQEAGAIDQLNSSYILWIGEQSKVHFRWNFVPFHKFVQSVYTVLCCRLRCKQY